MHSSGSHYLHPTVGRSTKDASRDQTPSSKRVPGPRAVMWITHGESPQRVPGDTAGAWPGVSSIVRVRRLLPQWQTQSQGRSLVEQTPNHPHPSLVPRDSATRRRSLRAASPPQEMLPERWGRMESVWARVGSPGREFKWKTTEADNGWSPVLPTQPAALFPQLRTPVMALTAEHRPLESQNH